MKENISIFQKGGKGGKGGAKPAAPAAAAAAGGKGGDKGGKKGKNESINRTIYMSNTQSYKTMFINRKNLKIN